MGWFSRGKKDERTLEQLAMEVIRSRKIKIVDSNPNPEVYEGIRVAAFASSPKERRGAIVRFESQLTDSVAYLSPVKYEVTHNRQWDSQEKISATAYRPILASSETS